MDKQLIIAVGREFGSRGHVVAAKLAERYGLPVYDRNLLSEVAADRNLDSRDLEEFDESKRNKLMSRSVRGFNSSAAHNVAYLQFDYLKKMAKEGKSFVIVGRCAETVLRDYEGMISIFILGDLEDKLNYIMDRHELSLKEAEALRSEKDRKRKHYHNSYCTGKWGDSRNYEISINVSKLGINGTVDVLAQYIDARRKAK